MKTAIPLVAWGTLIGLAVSAGAGEQSAKLFSSIREADVAAVQACLSQGAKVTDRDEAGNTPLIAAAFYGEASMLEALLKAGAEVNAANAQGVTALMRAATFPDKARLLTANKADVKARSKLGNDALILAARLHGNVATVKLLLEHGAEANGKNTYGATPLMAAAAAEDLDIARALLDAGADVNAMTNMNGDAFIFGGGRSALMWAAYRGNEPLLKLLLERGAKANEGGIVGGALTQAAWGNKPKAARILLEAGAKVDQRDLIANFTPLHWAASSERGDPSLAELLLAHGADPNAEGGQPVDNFLGVAQTPLTLALKRGETPIAQALRKAGAREASHAKPAKKSVRLAEGAEESAPLGEAIAAAARPLEKTALESPAIFLRHASKQNCVSCHQQQLPLLAFELAREKRSVDGRETISRLLNMVKGDMSGFVESGAQATFYPEPAVEYGYTFQAFHRNKRPASFTTDGQAHHLATTQQPDGRWAINLPRPPIQASDVGATALAIHALQLYPIPARRAEFAQRVARAAAWLEQARAETNEEQAHQLLGLAWAGASADSRKKLAEALLHEQRSDGGWAQLAKLNSDAFATGQALFALMTAGEISAKHEAVQKGLRFLLRTQLADGTWHVRRRAFPFQPPMDSGFPHGADSWISAAGTSWAVMALATATQPGSTASVVAAKPVVSTEKPETPTDAPAIDFAAEIKPILERSCVGCHSGDKPKGNYAVTSHASLLQGGNRGEPAIVPGQSGKSALLQAVKDQIEDLEMPPLAKREKYPALTETEIASLRAWVDQGAKWPEGVTLARPAAP